MCTDLLAFYLMAEKNPGKPQLGDKLMTAVRTVIASNEVPYFQMTSIGLHSTLRRNAEGRKKERRAG